MLSLSLVELLQIHPSRPCSSTTSPVFLSKHVSKSPPVIWLELITLLATVSQHFFVSLVRLGQLCFVIELVAHICLLQGILNNSSAGVVAFENLAVSIVFCSLHKVNQCL